MTIKEKASYLRNQYVGELRDTEDTLNLIRMGLNDFNELDDLAENSINNIKKSRKVSLGLFGVWCVLLPMNLLCGNYVMAGLSVVWLGIEGYSFYKNSKKLKEIKELRKITTEKADQIKNIKDLLQSRQKFIERQIERLTDVAHCDGTIKEEELQSIKQSLQKLQASEYYNPYENVIDADIVDIVER